MKPGVWRRRLSSAFRQRGNKLQAQKQHVVKFLNRAGDLAAWERYFAAGDGVWGNCRFVFDRQAAQYDWLVAYDDVPPSAPGGREDAAEWLACPRQQTILVTTEPESIKAYGRGFAAQFGHVLTSQPAWALPHRQRHWQQAANHWFYGDVAGEWLSREQLLAGGDDKRDALSVVYSAKRQWHTQHARRFAFIETMRAAFPDMAVFGRGATPMRDKREALDPFRYHLAVENHIAPHHITEKLTDAFLGRCLPFYAGAPNAADYFPADSLIAINLYRPQEAIAIIREAMASQQWQKRQEAIAAARRCVLEEQHLFAIIARLVNAAATGDQAAGGWIFGRHAWRKRYRLGAAVHMGEKLYVRSRALWQGWSRRYD